MMLILILGLLIGILCGVGTSCLTKFTQVVDFSIYMIKEWRGVSTPLIFFASLSNSMLTCVRWPTTEKKTTTDFDQDVCNTHRATNAP